MEIVYRRLGYQSVLESYTFVYNHIRNLNSHLISRNSGTIVNIAEEKLLDGEIVQDSKCFC